MTRCEDYPCCGHDTCPVIDEEGRYVCQDCGTHYEHGRRIDVCDACARAERRACMLSTQGYHEDDGPEVYS